MKKRLVIVDVEEEKLAKPIPGSSRGIDPKNLENISQARKWICDPNNWFSENTRIVKWEGLVPKVAAEHGMRVLNTPNDDGLPWAIVFSQLSIKRRGLTDEEQEMQ